MNQYHYRLNIPVKFNPVFPVDAPVISVYDKTHINEEVISWLSSLGLQVGFSELFHLIAKSDHNSIPIHVDSLPAHINNGSDHVKINFVYCDAPSTMNWFVCKDTSKLQTYKTPVGTDYVLAKMEDCELVHSAQVGQPSIVNAGILHNISTVTSDRYCFSITPLKDGKAVSWKDAVEIFKDYMEDDAAVMDCDQP